MTALILEMKASGMGNTAIAKQLNEEGKVTARGLAFTPQLVANIVARKDRGIESIQPRTPHEILAKDPTNKAALMDLADREAYREGRGVDVKRIREINRAYAAKR